MLAYDLVHSRKDDLLCHKHASTRRINVLRVAVLTLRRRRGGVVVDHGVRDPRVCSGRRDRLKERHGTTQHSGLRGFSRRDDAVGEAATSGRDSAVLPAVVFRVRGVRRGV